MPNHQGQGGGRWQGGGKGNQGGGSPQPPIVDINQGVRDISSWIENGLTPAAIDYAERLGGHLQSARFTTSQIRNIFGEVRRIQMNYDQGPVLMLKPRLAYAAKRADSAGAKDFAKVLTGGLDAVVKGTDEAEKEKRFGRLADFFEAVLAYHKAAGGK